MSKPTIGRLESIDSNEPIGGRPETGEALVTALEKAGIELALGCGWRSEVVGQSKSPSTVAVATHACAFRTLYYRRPFSVSDAVAFGALLSVSMPRTFWIALICLLAVSVLFAVRTGFGTRLIPVATASLADATTASAIDEEPPLAKADRLPSRYFPVTPSKTTVSTIEIAPTSEPEKARPTASVSGQRTENHEVTSWHWHVGSKITKRTTVARDR